MIVWVSHLSVPCSDYRAMDGFGQGNEVSPVGPRALSMKGRRYG